MIQGWIRSGIMVMLALGLFNRPVAAADFDHTYAGWQKVIDQHLKDGKVNYQALKAFPKPLNDVYQELQAVESKDYNSWSDDQKIAFWINVYNVTTMKLVVDNYPLKRNKFNLRGYVYPPDSIQQIKDVWNLPYIQTFRGNLSLNDIEHEILRQEFTEPRIHFAVVCASTSCPVLREEPFVADKLEEQLVAQSQRFLAHPEKFRYDARNDVLYMSQIFKWFGEDFDVGGGSWAFVRAYSSDPKRDNITENSRIEWLDYDWSLNDQN